MSEVIYEGVEVDIESIEEGEWFPYQNSYLDKETEEWIFEEPAPKARVRVRSPYPFLQERYLARKKAVEHVLNTKTRSMERIEYFKDLTPKEIKKEADDTWDYIITGLEFFKVKGEVLECTKENKLKLKKSPPFDRFVNKCLKVLEGEKRERIEKTEKN